MPNFKFVKVRLFQIVGKSVRTSMIVTTRNFPGVYKHHAIAVTLTFPLSFFLFYLSFLFFPSFFLVVVEALLIVSIAQVCAHRKYKFKAKETKSSNNPNPITI